MGLSAGTKLGRYEIRAKIGGLGMGELYHAYPAKMNRFVSAALRSVLSLLLVAFAIPNRSAAGIEFAANRSQASLSASHLKTEGRLFGDSQPRSGNPIITGWYADPEAHIFKNEYWVYPTYSAPYEHQVFFDAFSSKDLITWKKHPRIFANVDAPWVKRALWAPSVVEKGGWYYLFFGANDIQNDQQLGGIGIARSRQPGGPFKDYLGKPLIDKFLNGAQPIDQFVFKDASASYYIIYGGWRHCNIAKLNEDFTGLVPFEDGVTFKEITPKGYVEGSFMFVKDGKYYFMWSEGGWTGPDYAVAYAVGSSVFGPFERIGKILQQNSSVATGAGHHSVLHRPGSSRWYIVYHRRPLGETDRNHRVVCIDEMHFDEKGFIEPVVITTQGVRPDPLP
jgi:beta-xylosidase